MTGMLMGMQGGFKKIWFFLYFGIVAVQSNITLSLTGNRGARKRMLFSIFLIKCSFNTYSSHICWHLASLSVTWCKQCHVTIATYSLLVYPQFRREGGWWGLSHSKRHWSRDGDVITRVRPVQMAACLSSRTHWTDASSPWEYPSSFEDQVRQAKNSCHFNLCIFFWSQYRNICIHYNNVYPVM